MVHADCERHDDEDDDGVEDDDYADDFMALLLPRPWPVWVWRASTITTDARRQAGGAHGLEVGQGMNASARA